MSKISNGITQATVSASAEGVISAEGNIGKNKSSGSIDSEGIWDLGIDFKVGGLGITNDYGGAITVSIAGQSITWGREGRKIHYDLGGFEVIVEARDCVVTETKKIMGMIVASHTYPDPGCKLPEPPGLPEPPKLPGPINPDGMTSNKLAYVLIEGNLSIISPTGYANSTKSSTIQKSNTVAEEVPENVPVFTNYLPFTVKSLKSFENTREVYTNGVWLPGTASGTQLHGVNYSRQSQFFWADNIIKVFPINNVLDLGIPVITGNGELVPLDVTAVVYYGKENVIASYIKYRNNDPNKNYSSAYTTSSDQAIVSKIIYVGKQPKPQPFLQPGVPPHMNNCCEEILDTLEDLKDVLHVDFFKKKKFPVPTYLLAPGCEPGKTTDAENYYHLFQKMFQAIAHNTIVSPQIDIQDADAVKEGDQRINERYLSATGWAEAVTKILYEILDDGNIGTNMDIRTGVTVTQLLVAVADLSYKVDCIIDCIGVTTKRTKGEVETSYNLVIEGENTKGFDPKKSNQQLDLNSDISTEKLLSGLLRTRKNPIVKEEIHPKSPTLFELLQDLKNK
ncbi:hypothetical protein QUB05_05585 [Microcoleus sp. F10-C6]|uniref:hypothetical protein n=1 Tax=unclassified Microcoleus TaxID=2642155 RepID=UPI002FD69DBD